MFTLVLSSGLKANGTPQDPNLLKVGDFYRWSTVLENIWNIEKYIVSFSNRGNTLAIFGTHSNIEETMAIQGTNYQYLEYKAI